MPGFDVTVVLQYTGDAVGMRKEFRQIREEELASTGLYWHTNILPKHFIMSAYGRYGYQARVWPSWMLAGDKKTPLEDKKKYEDWKRKKFGHNKPMVQTGQMERQLKSNARVRVTRRGLEVTMTSRGLSLATRTKIAKGYPDFRKEITTVTGSEGQFLAGRLDKRVTKRLRNVRSKRTVKG